MAARRRLPWVILAGFLVVPVVEIYVLIQVGQVIGAWWTVLLLIAVSLLGSWVIRREGARAWRSLREALDSGRMPAAEIADGALILVGGTLMLTPGFVSDVFGVLMILPITRPIFRGLLAQFVARRLDVMATSGGPVGPVGPLGPLGPTGRAGGAGSRTARRPGPVVRGEVVDEPER